MIRFEEPVFLWICVSALLMVPFLFYYQTKQMERFSKFADPKLLPGFSTQAVRKYKINAFGLALAVFLTGISLANPQWSSTKTTLSNSKSDVFIVMDVSRSMTAEDIKPSRLDKSKQFLYRLTEQLKSNRIGLILFAGRSYLQMPLTDDLGALSTFIGGADPDMIPAQGTAIGSSIDLAMRMFNTQSESGKMIIVISDGEDHDEGAVEAAKSAHKAGAEVYTIGVGTSEGGTMPVYQVGIKDVKRDEDGQPIITKMNPAALREIAKAGGGNYFNASNGEAAIKALRNGATGGSKGSFKKNQYKDFESFFQWFLIPALLIFLFYYFKDRTQMITFRKNVSLLAFFIFSFGVNTGNAFSQESMNPARNADKLYQKGNFTEAEEKYNLASKKEPDNQILSYNKANAQYKQNKFAEAEKSYEKVIRSKAETEVKGKAFYNQGNTYFKQEKYQEAIERYKNSLKINPSDIEAKKNLSIALKKRKKQQQEQKQDQKQGQKEKNKNEGQKKQHSTDDKNNQQSKEQQERSREEAERLLRIIENEEKNVMKKMPKQRSQDNVNEKDW